MEKRREKLQWNKKSCYISRCVSTSCKQAPQKRNTFAILLFSVNQDIDSQHYMSVRRKKPPKTINASPQIFHTSVGSVKAVVTAWVLGIDRWKMSGCL